MRLRGSRQLRSSCVVLPRGSSPCPAHTRCHEGHVAGRTKVMGRIDEQGNSHDSTGRFDGRIRIDPERSLSDELLAQYPDAEIVPVPASPGALDPFQAAHGNRGKLTWVVQGDDHETRLVEAESADAAAEYAAAEFSDQYDEEIGADSMSVLGAFRGTPGEVDAEDFVEMDGMDRSVAVRALREAD